jgi:hypothetical protein
LNRPDAPRTCRRRYFGDPGYETQRPFADALRIEIAAAGDNQRVLRAIARNVLFLAQQPEMTALPAIRERLQTGSTGNRRRKTRSHCARLSRANSPTTIWLQSQAAPRIKDEEIPQDPKPNPSMN